MNTMKPTSFLILLVSLTFNVAPTGAADETQTGLPKSWSIPVAGNLYCTAPEPGNVPIGRSQTLRWRDAAEEYSLYFHVDRNAKLNLKLEARIAEGEADIEVSVGELRFPVTLRDAEFNSQAVGSVTIDQPGYVQLKIKGKRLGTESFGEIKNLIVESDEPDLHVTFVASNEGNMFYWGRRGPSVHLSYPLPPGVDVEWGYSEILVAEGDDPLGSYFMANGFREGYFGIQVNSERERRVLFSVWSPFQTDNPKDIPADQQIQVLARGPDIRVGEFGNEGSGGQSYLIYPWEAGKTYRFLTRVTPDGAGNTDYSSWFGDKEANEWRLIASFRRPKTDTHLQGFHSFLENFNPATGHLSRRGQHGKIWVCDTTGQWHECLQARFSVDATGGGKHRLDFMGGAEGSTFFLRNCGFFAETGKPGETFQRKSAGNPPQIHFDLLPMH